jgi:hypothetical protein
MVEYEMMASYITGAVSLTRKPTEEFPLHF